MAKLRYHPKSGSFEWEGSPEELRHIFEDLMEWEEHAHINHKRTSKLSDLELLGKMPSTDKLVMYILSKPNFEHDILDIAMKFFGRRIRAREDPNIYRKLSYELKKARKEIEASHRGTFEQKATSKKNLKRYVFQPLTQTLSKITQKYVKTY